eukprot:765524-Hanusia_phi.AAC.6
MKRRQTQYPQTMTARHYMSEKDIHEGSSRFVGLRPTDTPSVLSSVTAQPTQRAGLATSASISPTSSYRFSFKPPQIDSKEHVQQSGRHSMLDESSFLRRSSSSVDLPASSLDDDRRNTFSFDVPPFTGTSSSSSANPRMDQSMSLYSSNGHNMSKSHKMKPTRLNSRSLVDITNIPSPSKQGDKGPLWYSSTITICDSNAAEWSKTKKSMLEEAVAAALDLPIEHVQAKDVRERTGRRLLSISLEVTLLVKAESKAHLNELRKRMVSE